MWSGPVEQLRPITSTPMPSRVVERGGDVGAEQHAPGRVERDLHLDRQVMPRLVEGLLAAHDGGLDLEDVLRGLDQQQVHAAVDQADGLLAEDVGQFVEGDVGQLGIVGGGQLAARADGAGDEARLRRSRPANPSASRARQGALPLG